MDKRNLLSWTSLGRKVDNQHVLEINPQISNINDFVSVNVNETLYPELDSRDFIGVAQSENILEQEAFIREMFDLFWLEFIEWWYKPWCDKIEEWWVFYSIMHNCNNWILSEEWSFLCKKVFDTPNNWEYRKYFYGCIIVLFWIMFKNYQKLQYSKYKKIIP